MNIKELSLKLWPHADIIIKHLLPNAEKISSGWQVGSIYGEKGQSLKITPSKKLWCDFNASDWGDLIDLWRKVKHIALSETIKEISTFIGIDISEAQSTFNLKNDSWLDKMNEDSITYLSSRGITINTINQFSIKDTSIFNHQTKQEDVAIAFPYYKNNKITQIKRIGINRIDGKKNIATEKGCEQYLFGHQNIKNDVEYIMICEGEIDCLTLYQYGFNVLSVPYGGGGGKKQQWINNEADFLAQYDKIYLCLDNDDVGNDACNDIARRLYDKQCYRVLLPYKDANECLIQQVLSEEIQHCFNQAKLINIRQTTLPISIGSDGFDIKQDYLIKNYIPTDSLCCIYGASGSFKTFLGISWACHIASGNKWDNNNVSQYSVLYIVGEGGIGVSKRIRAWELKHKIKLNNLYLVNRPVFIMSENDIEEINKACNDIKKETNMRVGFIVVDTLARCLGDADENTAKDMGGFISGCDRIKNMTGASVLLIHHTGKMKKKELEALAY